MLRAWVVLLFGSVGFGQQSFFLFNPFIGSGPAAPGSILAIPVDSDASHYSVQVAGLEALILGVEARQLRFVVPAETPLGTADVVLSIDGDALPPVQIEIVHAAPALIGHSVNQLTKPALPGDFVVLWATGLGDLTEADVKVDLAGKMITPSFAGRAPGQPGVDQINFQVPADAQRGCYVPVMLQAADVISDSDVLAISDSAEACPHPLGLSVGQMAALDRGNGFDFGWLRIDSSADAFGFDPRYQRLESTFVSLAILPRVWSTRLAGFSAQIHAISVL